MQVEDQGRGIPVDYNPNEKRYNWELLFCEMYAGGKYNTDSADSYEYALGLNGLGLCSTQYASAYMDVSICRDGFEYELHFKKGEPAGEMKKTPTKRRDTGSVIRWLPDLEVFTDIDIPIDYYRDTLKRQAVVNPGVQLLLRSEREDGGFDEESFYYEHGIEDYVTELLDGEEPSPRCSTGRPSGWAGTGRTSRTTRSSSGWPCASPTRRA